MWYLLEMLRPQRCIQVSNSDKKETEENKVK